MPFCWPPACVGAPPTGPPPPMPLAWGCEVVGEGAARGIAWAEGAVSRKEKLFMVEGGRRRAGQSVAGTSQEPVMGVVG
jgi:hypothetical protein